VVGREWLSEVETRNGSFNYFLFRDRDDVNLQIGPTMKIYVMSYHGDVQSEYPAFVREDDAEQFQRDVAKGCFVETMTLIGATNVDEDK
jgi:hypothetical protein